MASRNRGRPGPSKDDADEERNIWNQLRSDAKRVDAIAAEADKLQARIVELVQEMEARYARGEPPSGELELETEDLCRQHVKLVDEITGECEGDSDQNNLSITGQIDILAALRASSEADSIGNSSSRNAAISKSQRIKRKGDAAIATAVASDDKDSMANSPAPMPSPKIVVPISASRQLGKSAPSRSGSVPAGREGSVKTEDGTNGADGLKAISENKAKLSVGSEVFSRNTNKPQQEGEGILCTVTKVIGEGKQRRYEIQDADPEPPTPQVPYRASVSNLISILPNNDSQKDLAKGNQVLALYPGTTTFYKAEVVATSKDAAGKDGVGKAGLPPLADGFVRLRFEGEDEADRMLDVERRYVLTEGGR